MIRPSTPLLRRVAFAALAPIAFAASLSAHATVGAPTVLNGAGDMESIAYGTAGNVFQLSSWLFVNGLGGANDPVSVTTLNPALSYSFAVSGANTGLLRIDYTLVNSSLTASFDQLRFMVFANPDGNQATFLDRVSETWGAAAPGGPTRREAQAFTFNPSDNIIGRLRVNNNLTDGAPSAECAAAAGCDAVVGMQWDAPLLAPGEKLVVSFGLSDDGQSLSSRFLTVSGVGSQGTVLTISGISQVSAVPEASTWAMLLAGMGVVGGLARRRGVVARS